MLVSLNWLNDYVDLTGLDATAVAAALTGIGLEVESVAVQSAIAGEVVVGRILTAVKHPNADTLQLCSVDVGEAEPLQVVCGAPNARAGLSVVVAKVGATLPGDFKIKKSKIRGETSCGMLCSEKELGLGTSHGGIIELAAAALVGEPVGRLLGLGDTLLEVNVTPNRPDCLGLVGLSRDLAAKLKRPLKQPPAAGFARAPDLHSEAHVKVQIADADGCRRFVALYVENVAVIPSPAWLAERLTAAGMRPINLIVDATNYAMLEYGQPVHAYDERAVASHLLAVREAVAGETLTTLDGQLRHLEAGDLLITDANGPIGLAGIMGGQSSEVRPDTRAVIIEVACFSPTRVRKTARRLGLRTEASHRFERGVDVDNLPTVALRVAALIARGAAEAKAAAPRVAATLIDAYPADIAKRVVALRLTQARTFLGLPALSRDEAVATLTALDFELLDEAGDRMVFEVPFFRPDIEREVDLIEEVGRIHGFDKIPYQLPVMSIAPTPEDPFVGFLETVRSAVAAAGLRETLGPPFVGAAELAALGLPATHPLYPTLSLANPLNEQQSLLAASLVPGLLRALAANRHHGDRGARLFECSRGYFDPARVPALPAAPSPFALLLRAPRHFGRRARGDAGRPVERHWLAAAIDQPAVDKSWNTQAAPVTFFHGKAAVMSLTRAFGVGGDVRMVPAQASDFPFLHPGASAVVLLGGKPAGYVGELHPQAAARLDLAAGGAPVVLELDLELLFELVGKAKHSGHVLGRFPPVTRDLALLVETPRTHADFEAAIAKFKRKKHLKHADLFDIYAGESLPAGKKSMAYSLTFQSEERTLTDQEVEAEVTDLVAWLGESLQATQR